MTGNQNFNVELPADCTSETNCNYICTSFVDAFGAKDEAKDLSSAKGSTLATKSITSSSTTGRRLADSVTVTYSNTGGYNA